MQMILKQWKNVFEASCHLLRITNDNMIPQAERVLAHSPESNDKSLWYCWTQYIGSELDSMSERQQKSAERNMLKWWTLMTTIYDKLAAII
jgi:hypothetical protein